MPTVTRKEIWKLTLSVVLSLAISHYPPPPPPPTLSHFPVPRAGNIFEPRRVGWLRLVRVLLVREPPCQSAREDRPGRRIGPRRETSPQRLSLPCVRQRRPRRDGSLSVSAIHRRWGGPKRRKRRRWKRRRGNVTSSSGRRYYFSIARLTTSAISGERVGSSSSDCITAPTNSANRDEDGDGPENGLESAGASAEDAVHLAVTPSLRRLRFLSPHRRASRSGRARGRSRGYGLASERTPTRDPRASSTRLSRAHHQPCWSSRRQCLAAQVMRTEVKRSKWRRRVGRRRRRR